MTKQEIQCVLGTVLTMMERIAHKTRTPVDDLLIQVLRRNEGKLLQAVEQALAATPGGSPSEQQIVAALRQVGIDV